jgi:hypothetical protein
MKGSCSELSCRKRIKVRSINYYHIKGISMVPLLLHQLHAADQMEDQHMEL